MALYKIEKNAQGTPTGEYETIAGGCLWADMPVGCIIPFGGTSIMAGFLLCDGRSLLKADYPELYSAIGDAFGSADSTHFNIPDMRESVPKGAGETGQTVGAHVKSGGLAVGEFLDDRVQTVMINENGTTTAGTYLAAQAITPASLGGGSYGYYVGNQRAQMTAYRSGPTTEVKSVGVNYIIKAVQVALPADLASGVEDVVEEVYGDVIPSDASASNKLVTESKCVKSSWNLFADAGLVNGTTYTIREFWQKLYAAFGECNFVGHVKWDGSRAFYLTDGTTTTSLIAMGRFDVSIEKYDDTWKMMHGTLQMGTTPNDMKMYHIFCRQSDLDNWAQAIKEIKYN